MTLLSIIIPTHNRAKYVLPTIKALLELPPDIQIVVCDTSETDAITAIFSYLKNTKRLKIIRPNKVLNVVDNFNAALEAADGEYLAFIGDDDIVTSKILDVAIWAKQNDVDSVKFNFPLLFYWHDFKHKTRGDRYKSTLHLSDFSGNSQIFDARQALNNSLKNFGGGVLEMPRAYAGLISKKLKDKIIIKYGKLFGGVSPDIYSSALISYESTKCYLVDYPIIIPGASGESGTGQSASGGHVGNLEFNLEKLSFANQKWDLSIPKFYSVTTVWGFSLLKAIQLIQEQDAHIHLSPNFARILVKCFAYHSNYCKETLVTGKFLFKEHGCVYMFSMLIKSLFDEFLWGFKRIFQRFLSRKVINNIEVINNLGDTYLARTAAENYLLGISKPLNLK